MIKQYGTHLRPTWYAGPANLEWEVVRDGIVLGEVFVSCSDDSQVNYFVHTADWKKVTYFATLLEAVGYVENDWKTR